jgi:predicted nucleic-acid-binding protein
MPSMAKKLPDTNTIVRYLIKDIPALYEKAADFFESVRAGEEKAIILESVFVECVYVLTMIYKVPKERVVDSLLKILRYKGILNDDKEALIEALTIFKARSIDIVDCILVAKGKSYNMTLFTFAKKLNTLFRNS